MQWPSSRSKNKGRNSWQNWVRSCLRDSILPIRVQIKAFFSWQQQLMQKCRKIAFQQLSYFYAENSSSQINDFVNNSRLIFLQQGEKEIRACKSFFLSSSSTYFSLKKPRKGIVCYCTINAKSKSTLQVANMANAEKILH